MRVLQFAALVTGTAAASLMGIPPASASDFDATTWTFSQPSASGTAEATATGDSTGAFSLTAEFDDPNFAVDGAAPMVDAEVLITTTVDLLPGVYDVSTTLEDVAGSATATGEARGAASFSVGATCPNWCWPLSVNGTALVDSQDGPQTRPASDTTAEERFVVLQSSTVTLTVVVHAWAGSGTQVADPSLASIAVHGPGSTAVEVTGNVTELSVNPAL